MFSRNNQGERRASPAVYKVLLTAHIIFSVGWLGTVFAKLVLVVAATATMVPTLANSLYVSTGVINGVFPPLAIGTLVSGVLLSLGTKWGLLRHYWVATKLLLTVGVVATAFRLSDRALQQAMAARVESAASAVPATDFASVSALLISLSVAHLLLLGAATVISVYKPWGRLGLRRPASAQPRTA